MKLGHGAWNLSRAGGVVFTRTGLFQCWGEAPMEHTPLSPRRVSELERPQCSRPALGPFLLGCGIISARRPADQRRQPGEVAAERGQLRRPLLPSPSGCDWMPVAGKVNGLAALHRQSGYAAHLIAIRDAAGRRLIWAAVARPSASPWLSLTSAGLGGRNRYTGTCVVLCRREAARGSRRPRSRGKSVVWPGPCRKLWPANS